MAEMIRRITEAGATAEVIMAAVACFEEMSGTSPGQVRDIVRKYERERRQRARKNTNKTKGNAEANDAAQAPSIVRDKSGTEAKNHCDLTSLPFLDSEKTPKEVRKKKGGDTRARGTRLTAEASLPDCDRQFALDNGMSPAAVDQTWAEFVDYWIGVPGQRGTKLDWSATWRNRVRSIGTKGKPHGYRNGTQPHRTELQLALDKAREFAARGDPEFASVPEDEPAGRH